jgi:prepilin-type N-terminal cleavage/methylation domain-containing protein
MKVTSYKLQVTNCRRGFTLIEMILYISILSVMILALTSFLYLSYTSRIKATVIAEVEQQGNQTMSLMSQNIRNSSLITIPTAGGSGSSLTLTEYTGALSPTVINQTGNKLQITEGANAAVDLTSNRVVVSGLTFQNLSRASTPGTVRIQFTLTHLNPDNRGEYVYSKTFVTSATLRQP